MLEQNFKCPSCDQNNGIKGLNAYALNALPTDSQEISTQTNVLIVLHIVTVLFRDVISPKLLIIIIIIIISSGFMPSMRETGPKRHYKDSVRL